MSRLVDIVRFYSLLDGLEQRVGGKRFLADLGCFRDCPKRGVYFFFEPSQVRRQSGEGLRVVRVGTHALTEGSRSTLRQRLGQHRGRVSGGGNHRGSIFRLLVGQALLAQGELAPCSSWGMKGDIAKASAALGSSHEALAAAEEPIEQAVSHHLVKMPFLWINIDDQASAKSLRGLIERNSIALLSNYQRTSFDPPTPAGWVIPRIASSCPVQGCGTSGTSRKRMIQRFSMSSRFCSRANGKRPLIEFRNDDAGRPMSFFIARTAAVSRRVSSETAGSCRWRLIWIKARRYSRLEASVIRCPSGMACCSDARGCRGCGSSSLVAAPRSGGHCVGAAPSQMAASHGQFLRWSHREPHRY